MVNPIFCRTRHTYESYTDFWRLVELSGFPCIYVDQIEPDSDNTYIVTPLNGEWNEGWQDPRATIILWDLEWRLEGLPVDYMGTNAPGINVSGISRIWASDKRYAEQIGAEYVPLGSHAGLAHGYIDNGVQKVYDVALLAYLGPPRRAQMVGRLQSAGIVIAPNGWGQERHNYLQASRAMLHIHQHDGIQTVAPQRWALAAAYGLPLITETLIDRGIFGNSNMLMCNYEHLPEFVRMWTLRNEARILEDFGRALHQLLCVERTFRGNVEAAL